MCVQDPLSSSLPPLPPPSTMAADEVSFQEPCAFPHPLLPPPPPHQPKKVAGSGNMSGPGRQLWVPEEESEIRHLGQLKGRHFNSSSGSGFSGIVIGYNLIFVSPFSLLRPLSSTCSPVAVVAWESASV